MQAVDDIELSRTWTDCPKSPQNSVASLTYVRAPWRGRLARIADLGAGVREGNAWRPATMGEDKDEAEHSLRSR
jgi:hypothetical protein